MNDWEEQEWDEAWDDDEDQADTIPCNECGREFYADAIQCPYCGEYVTESSHPWANKPKWLANFYRIIVWFLIFAMTGSAAIMLWNWLIPG